MSTGSPYWPSCIQVTPRKCVIHRASLRHGGTWTKIYTPLGRRGIVSMTLQAPQALPDLEQVLFVECGVGCDQHGQNVTKAVLRACRNAIEFNSIPCIKKVVPNGYDGMVVTVKIGCPRPDEVDLQAVKAAFPYGNIFCQAVEGGLIAPSGVQIEAMGDTEDALLIAVVAVTVGYGLDNT